MASLAAASLASLYARPVRIGRAGAALATSSSWELTRSNQTIKGFADKVSAADGEQIGLYVTTPAPTFDVEVYRLGWYEDGAAAARLVDALDNQPGSVQPPAHVDPTSGLISAANWSRNTLLTVGGWPSGLYALKLIASDGDQNYVPLVVRDDARWRDFLLVHAAATDQAYNYWGGRSLYPQRGADPGVKVSFDRPFAEHGLGISLLNWELNMARWLEANGFDVAYATDLDVHADPRFDARVRAVLLVGHNEYWSREMRENLEGARDRGRGLGFFTGDTGGWAVRYEDSRLGPNRVEVCYRKLELDPVASIDPSRATVHWHEAPLSRPVSLFMGIGTGELALHSGDWVVAGLDEMPGLFADTGFQNGDIVPNLVGYEYDGLWTLGTGGMNPPGNVRVLGRAPVISGRAQERLLSFYIRNNLAPNQQPTLGALVTGIETVEVGHTWKLYLRVTAGLQHWYLEYYPAAAAAEPARFRVGTTDYAAFKLGLPYADLGWRPIERELDSDFSIGFGFAPPADARVESIVVRGSLSLDPLVFIGRDGVTVTLGFDGPGPESAGWRVEYGNGAVSIGSTPGGTPKLVVRADVPDQRRDNEAHTVAIPSQLAGLVIAVGSVQWSWALDGFGRHVDGVGRETRVDARVQTLTRNMLFALRGG